MRCAWLDRLGWPGDRLLSQALRHSTIGAEVFDGRVRDGIGSGHLAKVTRPAKPICAWSAFEASWSVVAAPYPARCATVSGRGEGKRARGSVRPSCWSGVIDGSLITDRCVGRRPTPIPVS